MRKKKLKTCMNRGLAVALAAAVVIPSMLPAAEAEVQVQAASAKGYEERLTPIMGWSSWNEFANNINQDIFISNMDLMEKYGLIDVGYEYFNIDDGYQGGRDSNTGLVTHNKAKFPNGMKYIADYAHSKGLKAGIYSDIGYDTCASGANGEGNKDYQNKPGTGYGLGVGLLDHEEEDLEQYFNDWGYDFIKVDWCGGRNLGWSKTTTGADHYIAVGEIIEDWRNKLGKDIIYNVCCWEFPGERVANSDADSWRTGGDLWANWDSITRAIDNYKNNAKYSKPGKANDLDMMQIGRGLTYEEDKSHFTMWCMAGSPLMIGADLRTISEDALSILKNEEMIAIDQDSANIGATVAKTISYNDGDSDTVQIWKKDLGKANSSTKAIAILNRADVSRKVTVSWKELGFEGDVVVRDLWQHKYLDVEDTYTVTVPAHGTVAWKVSGEEESTSGDTSNASVKVEITDKQASMNLTELGNADWMYYGKSGDVTFRRKADTEALLSYKGSMPANPSNSDYYTDSATAYSWRDGTVQASGSNVKAGLTIGKTIDSYGQIDALSDYREHVLYVPVTGWRSNIRIDVLVDGKVVESQTVNEAKASDGQPRVNKLVKVTYSTKESSTVSVRWTIVGQSKSNGNAAVEAAALYIDPNASALPTTYGIVNDMLDTEIDFTGKEIITNSGEVKTELGSAFNVTLPAANEMKKAEFYLGATDADLLVEAAAADGTALYADYITGDDIDKVVSLFYKSASNVKVSIKLASTTGANPQMRLNAVTLAKSGETIVLNPTVSQTDDIVNVKTRIIRPENATAAKTLEVKVYDNAGNLKSTNTTNVDQTAMDTTVNLDVTLATGFTGKATVRVLDAKGNALSETFTYRLPLSNRNDHGFIGRYTAQKMVKEGAVLVDVRGAEDFAKTGIKGAINIPQGEILTKGPALLAAAGATKTSNIIVYCRTGKRSEQSRQTLLGMGYTNVYDFGGYEKWNTDPTITFTDYQEVILNSTPLYITVAGTENDKVEVKYSVGKNSTVKNAKTYSGPFKLNESTVVKAYILFDGEVVYEKSNEYLVFEKDLPDLSGKELVYCSDLTPKLSEVAWKTVINDKTSKDRTMKMGGVTFERGISAHAPSTVTYNIPNGANRFVAAAGCDDEVGNQSFTILYSIYVDGKLMDRTVRMTTGRFYLFDIAVPSGAKELTLVAKQGNSSLHSNTNMHSEWGLACFVLNDSSVGNGDRIEAEAGTLSGDAVVVNEAMSADCSGGKYVGNVGGPNNGTATLAVESPAAGKAALSVYYATAQERPLKVAVNGKEYKLTCASTGGWNVVGAPVKLEVDVKAGNNTIQLTGVDGAYAPNVDYIEIALPEAAMDVYSFEIENGTLSGEAKISSNSGASGKKYVSYVGGSNNGTSEIQVAASAAGTRTMRVYYGTAEQRPLKVVVNGKEYKLTCASTGGWTTMKAMELEVAVKEGLNTIKFAGVDGAYAPNLDRFEIELPEVKNAMYRLEAENGERAGSVTTTSKSSVSGGKYAGNIGGPDNGTITFKAAANVAGKRTLRIYYATAQNRTFGVVVNGTTYLVDCASTGGWNVVGTPIDIEVELKAGVNTIAVTGVDGAYAPNLDCIDIELTEHEAAAL